MSRKKPSQITECMWPTIERMLNEGVSWKAIGRELNIWATSIQKAVQRKKETGFLEKPRFEGKNSERINSLLPLIIEMVNNGKSLNAIAAVVGIDSSNMTKLLRSRGIQYRTKELILKNSRELERKAHQAIMVDYNSVIRAEARYLGCYGKREWESIKTTRYQMMRYHSDPAYKRMWLERQKNERKCPLVKARKRKALNVWRMNNVDHLRAKKKEWAKKNPDKMRNYAKMARQRPRQRMIDNLRKRLRELVKVKTHNHSELVGCTRAQLRAHIERQFIGCMSWENYGTSWHIDHEKPCAIYDLSKIEEQRKCFHFSNLRPLWAKKNIKEGARRGRIFHENLLLPV